MSARAKLAELERVRDLRRRELDVAASQLEAARSSKAAAEDLWTLNDGRPLPFAPLACALLCVVCANVAAFSGWIVLLSRWSEVLWDAMLIGGAAIVLVTLPFAKRFGAGGRARIGLRRVTLVFLVLALVEAIVAVIRTP